MFRSFHVLIFLRPSPLREEEGRFLVFEDCSEEELYFCLEPTFSTYVLDSTEVVEHLNQVLNLLLKLFVCHFSDFGFNMLMISCSFEHCKVSNYFVTVQIFRGLFFKKKFPRRGWAGLYVVYVMYVVYVRFLRAASHSSGRSRAAAPAHCRARWYHLRGARTSTRFSTSTIWGSRMVSR